MAGSPRWLMGRDGSKEEEDGGGSDAASSCRSSSKMSSLGQRSFAASVKSGGKARSVVSASASRVAGSGKQQTCGSDSGSSAVLKNIGFASVADGGIVSYEVVSQDRKALAELGDSMVTQLNQMYSCMHQVIGRERARHSSQFAVMMRKVGKDLKDTFRVVRETFAVLTEQLMDLAREVEDGRKQVGVIQERYAKASVVAESQSQYVKELEDVLDGQGAGLVEVLRKATSEATAAKAASLQAGQEGRLRERALQAENISLKMQLRKFQEGERLTNTALLPARLPELAASWTLRANDTPGYLSGRSTVTTARGGTPAAWSRGATASASTALEASTPTPRSPPHLSGQLATSTSGSRAGTAPPGFRGVGGASAAEGVDVVGSMLAHSDANRAAPRRKCVPTPVRERWRASEHGEEQVKAKLRCRAEDAEEQWLRQHRVIEFASPSLLLLRNIFNELLDAKLIGPAGVDLMADQKRDPNLPLSDEEIRKINQKETSRRTELLERICQMFYAAIPKLGNLTELSSCLATEAEGRLKSVPFAVIEARIQSHEPSSARHQVFCVPDPVSPQQQSNGEEKAEEEGVLNPALLDSLVTGSKLTSAIPQLPTAEPESAITELPPLGGRRRSSFERPGSPSTKSALGHRSSFGAPTPLGASPTFLPSTLSSFTGQSGDSLGGLGTFSEDDEEED